MDEQTMQRMNFYEMWSSIYTLEAVLDASPDRALRQGNSKLWRILWNDASAKITMYLRRPINTALDDESLAAELLAAERSRLYNEIMKISTFNNEAGEALWKNSASVRMVSSNIRHLVHALRAYLERERQFLMPRKGAAA